jgi:hypothetical protein
MMPSAQTHAHAHAFPTARLVSKIDPSNRVSADVERFPSGGCLAEADLELAFAALGGSRAGLSLAAVQNRLKLFFPDATREEAAALLPDGAAALTLADAKLLLLDSRQVGFDVRRSGRRAGCPLIALTRPAPSSCSLQPFAEALRLFSEDATMRDASHSAHATAHGAVSAQRFASLAELRRVSEALAAVETGGARAAAGDYSSGVSRPYALAAAWDSRPAVTAALSEWDADRDGRIGVEDARKAVAAARNRAAASAAAAAALGGGAPKR